MKNFTLLAAAGVLALSAATAGHAQDTLNSTSGSAANANSGSVSGAESNGNQQGQQQNNSGGNNAGIGSSRNDLQSQSSSGAISGSESNSGAVSDQAQGQSQGQSANNSQGQSQTANAGSSDQGQMQSSSNANTLGATNSQGVQINQTYNTTQRKKTITEFRANTAVMLAASSSFSSDYCGGTASGGASTSAPIGLTIGGSGPTFDNSCRYLRLAEKAGMLGANYYNMQQPESAMKAMSLMSWAVCMSGPQQDKRKKGYNENLAMQACVALGLLGGDVVPATPPAPYVAPVPTPAPQEVTPMETQKPNMTPDDYGTDLAPKTPRGSNDTDKTKITPMAIAH